MTTNEITSVLGLLLMLVVNISALVWGAAKMSTKVDNAIAEFKGLRADFKGFLTSHHDLELKVERHDADIQTLKGE